MSSFVFLLQHGFDASDSVVWYQKFYNQLKLFPDQLKILGSCYIKQAPMYFSG